MKTTRIVPLLAFTLAILSSCSSSDSNGDTTPSKTPLTLAEKINKYEPLKTYTDFTLGSGVGVDLYLNNANYRKIVNDNYKELTAGYEMKHAGLVNSSGEINFTKADAFVAKAKEGGLSVFGHTLVWHSNQNASYINSLIAPTGVTGPSGPNMVANGDFEAGGVTGWSQLNGAANSITLVGATNANAGNGAMKITNAFSDPNTPWNTQIHTNFSGALIAGQVYTLAFMIRSDGAGSFRCSTSGTARYQSTQTTSTTWQQIKWVFTSDGNETGFNFDLGAVPGSYYIDGITMTSAGTTTGGVAKTDAEKTKIIGDYMVDYVSKVVTHYKSSVFAWDVVNEPMREDGTLRNGTETGNTDADFFSWVKYLGQDYAVTAFKTARQYGNPTDKLFINDYNLEYSLAKCDGIITYVKYLESKGAVVDGIGTQMHISSTADRSKIVQMFQKLAASGKLIKISELDVKLGTNAPTSAQLEAQSDMYKYVIDSYKSYVPKAQQYGVTIWGVSDSVNEHQYWLPNDAPNLWDANFARKYAYKGVADALAGKDVSLSF